MKKNMKFRNNGGSSNAYSLNYKFDSISPAGKINGTALDLIKKYNELAKEAHGSGDYIEMEVYRQYAEHYRKIVTEINERRNVRQDNTQTANDTVDEASVPTDEISVSEEQSCAENVEKSTLETVAEQSENTNQQEQTSISETTAKKARKSFKVIEIKQPQKIIEEDHTETTSDGDATQKVKRQVRKNVRRKPSSTLENEQADAI